MTDLIDPGDESTRGGAAARLELAISAVVTATVLGAVLWVGRSQGRLQQSDAELNLAYVACQSQLEALRQLPFSQLASVDGSGFDVLGSDGSPGGLTPMPGDRDGLPGQLTVMVDKANDGAVLYRVTASVAWQGALREQTFGLDTLVGARQ